jgi:predicted dehydrogenase
LIGAGDRGSALLRQILAQARPHNAEVTAVCDVWRGDLGKAVSRVGAAFGREPRSFTRFGDLLALRDVDSVVIATPAFGHAPIPIEALKGARTPTPRSRCP